MGEKVNPAGETGQRSRRHGLECPLDVKQGKNQDVKLYEFIDYVKYFSGPVDCSVLIFCV